MTQQLETALQDVRKQIQALQAVEASITRVLHPVRRGRPPKILAALDPLVPEITARNGKRGRPRKEAK